jgi:acetamidase/formamidase
MLRTLALLALPILAIAETHTVTPTRYVNSFDHRHEVLARVKPGDTVVTKTLDAGGYDLHTKKLGERSNPLTGPFFVEGAEPGDAIAVTFTRMRLNRDFGWSAYRLGLYSINPEQVEGLYSSARPRGAALPDRENLVRWDLDLAKNIARLHDPKSSVHPMQFATKPMIGCIGVAAPGAFGAPSAISGNYGGNMDYNRINEGATVVLPVFHPGALLFIGDGHALQADGEPTGTGIETSLDITFTVALRKRAGVGNPRVETPDYLIAIGSQPEFVTSLDRSLRVATSEMVDWLVRDYKMEPWAAHLLIGYQGQYDVVTVAGSMALRIPRSALPGARALQ